MVRLVTVPGFAAFLYAGSAWAQAPAPPPPAVGVVKAEKTPIVGNPPTKAALTRIFGT
jgi:hypothetical protein